VKSWNFHSALFKSYESRCHCAVSNFTKVYLQWDRDINCLRLVLTQIFAYKGKENNGEKEFKTNLRMSHLDRTSLTKERTCRTMNSRGQVWRTICRFTYGIQKESLWSQKSVSGNATTRRIEWNEEVGVRSSFMIQIIKHSDSQTWTINLFRDPLFHPWRNSPKIAPSKRSVLLTSGPHC